MRAGRSVGEVFGKFVDARIGVEARLLSVFRGDEREKIHDVGSSRRGHDLGGRHHGSESARTSASQRLFDNLFSSE